jgi:hypothetical protein
VDRAEIGELAPGADWGGDVLEPVHVSEPAADAAALTNDGCPKWWVVVRPPCGATGVLLARADGEDQAAFGKQAAERAGFSSRSRTSAPRIRG